MPVLTESDRFAVWARFMRENTEACNVAKAEVRAAVNTLDDWLDQNAATINAAIPLPARSGLTTAQKSRLLTLVQQARYGG